MVVDHCTCELWQKETIGGHISFLLKIKQYIDWRFRCSAISLYNYISIAIQMSINNSCIKSMACFNSEDKTTRSPHRSISFSQASQPNNGNTLGGG